MTGPGEDPYKVEAGADKRLFVSMLIRDIELIPAVIDLVDNSVDGARATSPGNLSKHSIELTVLPERFEIKDDCGGIDLNIARHYAFRFGRPKDYDGVEGSVGQFGVGMKRALFKLGNNFEVESRTSSTAFSLPVNVSDWLEDENSDWQFKMSSVDEKYNPAEGGVGTTIRVSELHETVREDFANSRIGSQLKEQLRLRHQSILSQGLKMTLNGEVLRPSSQALLSGAEFSPINRRFVVTVDGGDVLVRIVAGIAASGSNENADDGDAEEFKGGNDAGWWIFCNDRLLIFADRTSLTGWGDPAPAYHPQYRRFRGYVYLSASKPDLLPWNTTKTGVDQDSRVWRRVQSEIKVSLGQVVSALNRLKNERESGEDLDETPISAALSKAKPVPLDDLPSQSALHAPSPRRLPRPIPRRRSTQKVQYDVELDRYREVFDLTDATSAADVGRRTFDYFYEREVEE
ncbi:ATP-binding protein [Amycolatopsis sp. NPDC026612]|uniref:ATP-binding protein n=1 Tax=Amycolatopsis sp. NPDC026612 TaxID=3155466 RepID=UPI0033CA9CA9